MAVSFSETNKLIDKIKFYIIIDFKDDKDIELLNEIIDEIKQKKRKMV